jgi:hypothetical protein
MLFSAALALVAVSSASPPPTAPRMHLRGLDRLYFTHVGGAETLTAPAEVARRLPLTLPTSRGNPTIDGVVADFPLPLPPGRAALTLRQVVDASHPRISELWLALYDGGRRSDVWHYRAYPNPDGKLLPNYWIESTRPGPNGGVLLRLRGEMVRPQGAWWATGKIVALADGDGALTFAHVRNAFGFRHDYDRDEDGEPPTHVRTEREAGARFEEHALEPAPAEVMKACGLPFPGEAVSGDWEELEAMAECIARAPGNSVSFRTPEEPSFAERGFKFKN